MHTDYCRTRGELNRDKQITVLMSKLVTNLTQHALFLLSAIYTFLYGYP